MYLRTIFALALAAFAGVSSSLAQGSCAPIPVDENFRVDAKEYSSSAPYSLDEGGVLVRDYDTAYGGLGKFHNPLFIATYALALHRDWELADCTDDAALERFFVQVDWFVRNAVKEKDAAVWQYPFQNEHYGADAGWFSGITQSRVASVLYRAAAIRHDKSLHDMASSALRPYLWDKDGLVVWDDGVAWIEEVPTSDTVSNKVLNGHIAGLQNLVDIAALADDLDFSKVIDGAVEAVRRDIHLFDAGFISYYSIVPLKSGVKPLANRTDYNRTHVDQLEWLARYTGDGYFQGWADVFRAYDERDDVLTADRSVNAETNGPDKATDLFYSYYWSSPLPTWIRSDREEPVTMLGVHIGSHSPVVVAADFTISVLQNGHWHDVASIKGNESQSLRIDFERPFETTAIRANITRAVNDGEIVALWSFSPILDIPKPN